MIDCTDLWSNFGTVSNAISVKTDDISSGFEELLKERTSPAHEKICGLIPESIEAENNNAVLAEVMEYMMKAVMSFGESTENIWDIVLRLEKSVDPELSGENINMDFDDTAGMNSIAGLLARFWKKKELLEENNIVFPFSHDHNAIDNKAVSELAALLRKSTG